MNATATAAPTERALLQTLDMLSESQQRAIRRIAPHDAATVPTIEARRPVSTFTGEDFFQLEQQRLFRKQAVPITVSARIADPGSAVAHDGYGIPLLVTRDKNGVSHVFLNACTHKGAKLIDGCDVAKGNRLTCPYHAWTFSTDGKLIGAARPETFANLDKSSRGLAELPSREAGGIIWAMLDRHAAPDFSGVDDQLAADFDAFELPGLHVYGHKQFHLDANWKLVLEPFLEGYHVQRLHASTVGPLFADVPNVVDTLGLNIRQISGKMNFTPDCLDIPGENIHASVTHAYNVFPNCVVVTSPYYISVMFLMPTAVDKTTVDYFMLTRRPPDNPKGAELYRKSYEMIVSVFGGEDFYAAQLSHAGLATGAIDDVVYSGLEATIPLYNEILDRVLAN
ncbi:phenylpropionate dioxygenase-like ring-hydroxylating dioxygenase large terminal subunit [Novosphingobium kunmingense]|uniref:Phenylpropionate dioxygenase-like ring-hydroxylating dioxygenase large terminal subunit n=1 Tax=Novosphingobium kunmingense TaxID=1211806 RepID=A0A2N0H7D7_9SPHN|nr:SRPBCC family protein [Novosphingobium kunmingense]PKB14790.1 phenylpropionate dioxygenase-like ring-hydroxylating dioxygenase large terminal subunit [Novosphingobium kunmingense]